MWDLGQLLYKKDPASLIWNAWFLLLRFSPLGFPHIVTNRENLVSLCFSHECYKAKLIDSTSIFFLQFPQLLLAEMVYASADFEVVI